MKENASRTNESNIIVLHHEQMPQKTVDVPNYFMGGAVNHNNIQMLRDNPKSASITKNTDTSQSNFKRQNSLQNNQQTGPKLPPIGPISMHDRERKSTVNQSGLVSPNIGRKESLNEMGNDTSERRKPPIRANAHNRLDTNSPHDAASFS